MATRTPRKIDYPTSDGRPMAETDVHRELMIDLIGTLEERHVNDPMVYVSGNLLVYFEEGDRRKHVAPDVFTVHGVEKRKRNHYLIWEEGKGLDLAIELTSRSTKREDVGKKFRLYEQQLRVPEYFLFDPFGEYLNPPLQGYRLRGGDYVAIRPLEGRLPSRVLGLHLERYGTQLRLYDPLVKKWLPTPGERMAQYNLEIARLRRELDGLRRGTQQRN